MPYDDPRDRKDSMPIEADPGRRWEGFSADDLKGNEIHCRDGVFAKIPQMPGLISRKTRKSEDGTATVYIELITERRYDREKKQMRNKRVCIGIDVSHLYRGMMIVNENYHKYFNEAGELINAPIIEKPPKKEKKKKMTEKKKEEKEMEKSDQEIQAELDRQEHIKDRFEFLRNMLLQYKNIVTEQASKKPDMAMSRYQVRRINELLKDIKAFMAVFEYGEYLQLAEEPEEGEKVTYGDMAILLQGYDCVMSSYFFGRIWYK